MARNRSEAELKKANASALTQPACPSTGGLLGDLIYQPIRPARPYPAMNKVKIIILGTTIHAGTREAFAPVGETLGHLVERLASDQWPLHQVDLWASDGQVIEIPSDRTIYNGQTYLGRLPVTMPAPPVKQDGTKQK